MKNARVVCVFVCAMLCLFGISASVSAQGDVAAVTGRVFDPNAAIIVEATVTARNVDTGVERSVLTNEDGIYRFASLSPGNYEFTVSKRGFKAIVKPGVTLHLADTISMNFNMVVGAINETVRVEAGASMLNTTDASVSTVVDQSYIKNMPLNGRSFQDLILLSPGVVTQTPQNNGTSGNGITGEFSVNGQRTEENVYTVDGVSANVGSAVGRLMLQGAGASGSLPGATALGTTQALVSVDELQEFRVQSSTYSAEYGRSPGGQFAFETKSGANQFHGTTYDYLRNNYFDANDWFNNYFGVKEAPLRQNDFGGTLGGPVRIPHLYNGKDKTFFFVSYEGLRLQEPQAASINYVPDATMIANAPAVLQQVLRAYPVANGPEALLTVQCDPSTDPACSPNGTKQVQSGLAEYIASWSNPKSINSTSVRFDHVVGNNLRLFFRFNDTGSASTGRGGFLTPSTQDTLGSTIRTYTAGATQTLTNRLNNDFRLNYTSNESRDVTSIDSFGGATPVDLVQLSGTGAESTARVTLLFGNYLAILNQGQASGTQKQWNIVDTASLALGRHQVKFGIDYRRLTPAAIPSPVFVNYSYGDQTQVDDPNNNSAGINLNAFAPANPLYENFSAFAQDEWKVSARLTLSMGLRWDVNPAPGVTKGINGFTLAGSGPATWDLAPQGTPLCKTAWYNFSPRLGAAYILRTAPGWETVVRGGGGVFFDTGQQLASSAFVLGPGFSASSPNPGSSFPIASAAIPVVGPPQPGTWGEGFGFAPHLQLPYTLQWNVSAEQALGRSQVLTVSYVGAHASRLLRQDFYLFPPGNTSGACCFLWVSNGLTSDYGSGQVQFRRRLSRGLTALASYTWAHAIDYGSQNYAIGYERGNSDLDVRHSMSSAFSYDVPNIGHGGLAGALLRHWGLDNRFTARSGFPVSLSGNGFLDPNGKILDEGLDIVQGQALYLYGANCASVLQGIGTLQPGQGCPGGRAINPDAFVNVHCPAGTGCQGTAPRNFTRGFGAWQMDLAVRREFPLYENLKLQFRAETFNIFNHPNFGTIGSFLGGNQFGLAR